VLVCLYRWTKSLVTKLAAGEQLTIRLQGPFADPPVNLGQPDAVVLVAGKQFRLDTINPTTLHSPAAAPGTCLATKCICLAAVKKCRCLLIATKFLCNNPSCVFHASLHPESSCLVTALALFPHHCWCCTFKTVVPAQF